MHLRFHREAKNLSGESTGEIRFPFTPIQQEMVEYFKNRSLRPAMWTFLIDKYRGISQTTPVENAGAFTYIENFYDELHIQYSFSEDPTACKFFNLFGEYDDMMRYKSITTHRLSDAWGCLRNNPLRSQCQNTNCDQLVEKSEVHRCRRGNPNIWVQEDDATPPFLAQEYLDAIQNRVVEDGLPIPLEKLGQFFYPNEEEEKAVQRFVKDFHLTDDELSRIFSFHAKPVEKDILETSIKVSTQMKPLSKNLYLIFIYGASMYSDSFDAYGFHDDTQNIEWVQPGVHSVLYCSSSYPKKEKRNTFVGVAEVLEITDSFEELEKDEWIAEKLRVGKTVREDAEKRLQENLKIQKYEKYKREKKDILKIPAKKARLRCCLFPTPLSLQDLSLKYPDFGELYRSQKDGKFYVSMAGIARLKEKEGGRTQQEWFELIEKEGGCEKFLQTYSLQDLKNFIENEMKVSEIYQPFIVLQLLKEQNPVSVDFLKEQIQTFENYNASTNLERSLTREPPNSQLVRKGFVTFERDKKEYRLNVQYKPSEILVKEIIMICEKKIQNFLGATPPSPSSPLPQSPPSSSLIQPVKPFTASLLKAQVDPVLKGIADNVYQEISIALNVGHHLILTGPPGTGKTTFAKKICELAAQLNYCAKEGPIITTATSDWTSFDTIGGYMPTPPSTTTSLTSSGETSPHPPQVPFSLTFQENIFLQAIRDNRWLVIDEINRAEIDKAFGPLLTVLSEFPVTLPFKRDGKSINITANKDEKTGYFPEEVRYNVGKHWRIIGTMNIYDKHMLYDLSYAFMRRFAFVDLDIPDRGTYKSLIEKGTKKLKDLILGQNEQTGEGQYIRLVNMCLKIFYEPDGEPTNALSTLQKYRKIGPAILIAIISYIESATADWEDFDEDRFKRVVAQAIDLFLVPQFEGLRNKEVVEIYKTTFEQFDSECQIILNRLKNMFSDASLGE